MGQTRRKSYSEIIDKATGEVITIEKTYNVKTSTDEFYMTFINLISPIFNITSNADRKVLDFLCVNAGFNTGVVSLTAKFRESLSNTTSISASNLPRSLKNLQKLGLIVVDKGEVTINPELFWKGSTDARNKVMKEQQLGITIRFKRDE